MGSNRHLRKQFGRTKCACPECSQYCHGMPGMLVPGDLERIVARVGRPAGELFLASPGARVAQFSPLSPAPRVVRIGTIVPAQRDNGDCVFLMADGLCEIHDVAPFGCSHFDSHLSDEEGSRRSIAALLTIQANREYQSHREALVVAGRLSRSADEKRAAVAANRIQ